ncbi:MAG: RNA polymerase sigma factor [Saprospiraceae bacterium]|nr:RNA polymerase sigma factor [Saprospiraceae bacterium]
MPMDVKDFQRLFLPLRHKLYRFALKFVRDQMAAEDIVQEVFLRIWNKGQDMVNLEHPEAYCMTMTRNLSLNYLKAKSRQNVGLDSAGEQVGTQVAADRMMMINERVVVLKAFIKTLSERQQLVLHLREVEELTYDEIASTLEISLAMVKSELFRARQTLKKKMEGHGSN